MKRILIAVAIALSVSSCMDTGKYRYVIQSHDNGKMYTNSYTVSGGCVTFVTPSNCGCSGPEAKDRTVTVCGTYTISDNPQYQPE